MQISRLALKIVVGTREQGTGNREQEESFGRFYFSSHTFKFFSSPTYLQTFCFSDHFMDNNPVNPDSDIL